MQGVVLAAGEGTRLRPLTADRPKALVTVDGRPICSWCFDRLLDAGVDELVVVVGYLGDRIRERYGDAYRGVPVRYATQDERLGVAHALACAEEYVDGPFPYLHGDNVFDPAADLSAVPRLLRDGADAVLTVEGVSRERARETGVVVPAGDGNVVADTDGDRIDRLDADRIDRLDGDRIDRIVEKPDDPPSTLAITGLHGFSPSVFDACRAIDPSDRGEYELPDAITWLLRTGHRVQAVRFEGWRVAVDYPEDRDRAERLIRGSGSGG
ncbi:UTP--glucose-1-phosphate uridylyltransferase [Halobacteriales archaeon QS_8_69_26]|nr:MAG: UTP--glucose-1-phosphate uridylyltransferase [Halobacteriales archaeon QS_8_69_26]